MYWAALCSIPCIMRSFCIQSNTTVHCIEYYNWSILGTLYITYTTCRSLLKSESTTVSISPLPCFEKMTVRCGVSEKASCSLPCCNIATRIYMIHQTGSQWDCNSSGSILPISCRGSLDLCMKTPSYCPGFSVSLDWEHLSMAIRGIRSLNVLFWYITKEISPPQLSGCRSLTIILMVWL